MPYKDLDKQKAAQRAYYDKNKQQVVAKAAEHRSRVVQYIQRVKQDAVCAGCGIDYPYWIMEFDHRPGVVKIGNVSAIYKTHSFEEVKAEIEKCDVVCSNCHKDRTRSRMIRTGNSVLFLDLWTISSEAERRSYKARVGVSISSSSTQRWCKQSIRYRSGLSGRAP